jgi:hypothetical protein
MELVVELRVVVRVGLTNIQRLTYGINQKLTSI